MKKCKDINTADSKIEYDICKDMYELLLSNTINTDEQVKQIKLTPVYNMVEWNFLRCATEFIHPNPPLGFTNNNGNIKANNKEVIDDNIYTLINDIDNRIRSCCKQEIGIGNAEDEKYFYAWIGSSLVDRDALKII